MFRRLIFSLPLPRFPERLRWAFMRLVGVAPVLGADGEDDKKFTQADLDRAVQERIGDKKHSDEDVNRIVQERLDRDRRERPSDDEITKLRDDSKELKTLKESGGAGDAELQSKLTTAEAERDAARNSEQTAVRRAAIVAAAVDVGADPDLTHAFLADRGFKVVADDKTLEVTIGDDGQVTGHVDAIKAALEAKPGLVGNSTPGPGPGDGGARGHITPSDIDKQIAEAESKGDWSTVNQLNAVKLGQVAAPAGAPPS